MKARSLSLHPQFEGIKTEISVKGGGFSEALRKACVDDKNKVRVATEPLMRSDAVNSIRSQQIGDYCLFFRLSQGLWDSLLATWSSEV